MADGRVADKKYLIDFVYFLNLNFITHRYLNNISK